MKRADSPPSIEIEIPDSPPSIEIEREKKRKRKRGADSPPSFEREMKKSLTSRAEAERLLGIAEWLLQSGHLNRCRDFAVRAQEIEPLFDGSDQILAIVDVLFAFETRTNNQPDWYSVLQLDRRFDDIEIIKRQYRRLFLLLHPDKNKYPAADIAFKLVADAWNVLSDPNRKAQYDGDSPPSIEIEREKKKRFMVSSGGEVYAVFESTNFLPFQDQYFIYKLDFVKDKEEGSPIVGAADPDIRYLGQPIATLNIPHLPLDMCIFSFGSKIYFCGGFPRCPRQYEIQLPSALKSHHMCDFQHSCYAYMFDVDLKQGAPIPSMQHPKPDPMVFGPVDGDKFYVFGNPDKQEGFTSSMEILNTSTHTWESIHIPTSLSGLFFSHASVLCGSNILFSRSYKPGLYSFSTIYKTWQQLSPFSFPFKQSLYLSHVPDIGGHILLGAPDRDYLPDNLYLLPNNPCDSYDDHLLTPLGNVEGLTCEELYDFLGGEREGEDEGDVSGVYIWNTPLSICVVRDKDVGHSRYHAHPEFDRHYHLAIDIFNLNDPVLDGSTKMIKVKVENTSQYKYVCGNEMRTRHFFVVG